MPAAKIIDQKYVIIADKIKNDYNSAKNDAIKQSYLLDCVIRNYFGNAISYSERNLHRQMIRMAIGAINKKEANLKSFQIHQAMGHHRLNR